MHKASSIFPATVIQFELTVGGGVAQLAKGQSLSSLPRRAVVRTTYPIVLSHFGLWTSLLVVTVLVTAKQFPMARGSEFFLSGHPRAPPHCLLSASQGTH